MSDIPEIDVRDLQSVRRAAKGQPDVVLGDDWVAPQSAGDKEFFDQRRKRGLADLRNSPIARKIITFNLIAMILLIAGVLYLNPSRDNLAFQRANSGDGIDVASTLANMDLRGGINVAVFDPSAVLVATAKGATGGSGIDGLKRDQGGTFIADALGKLWERMLSIFGGETSEIAEPVAFSLTPAEATDVMAVGTQVQSTEGPDGTTFVVLSPIEQGDRVVGIVSISSAAGELDQLVRHEREQVLRLFLVGLLISVGLSLVLASTIANPLADLAAAAELGRDKNARKMSPTKVRIPDLTGRPDEIGRLSGALRGMVRALYERIEGNEQFAADVAHEIKNPLASLRSAVGTLHIAKRDDQREKLLEVIEHDVQRMDRLVSDIASASRLDSELVKEEEEAFDLLKMLGNLGEFLGKEADAKGVDFIADLPDEPIFVMGLEGRLAQVFVNLITNAISFCEDGDAIRVWARKRENRVLVVVEDTGPGIPNDAVTKVFQRFYSERPEQQFGNNSGLGLAISKQIVEAHGGVIWAENIRPTDADMTSDPLGARFVVGLPV